MPTRQHFAGVLTAGLVAAASVTHAVTAAAAAPAPHDPSSGPHARDEARHAVTTPKLPPAYTKIQPLRAQPKQASVLPGAVPVAAVNLAVPSVNREVLGFAPYWELPANAGWRYDLLTTVAYFGLDVKGDGSFDTTTPGWTGWNSQDLVDTINRAHQAGDRVEAVIKQFDEATINTIVTTPSVTQAAVTNTINAIADKQLDGVNVDFEGSSNPSYPNIQSGMTNFVSQLSGQVHARWPSAMVSVDTYTGSASWDGGIFKIGDLAPVVDALFVMAYDMAASNMAPNQAGPNAPLLGNFTYNDTTAVAQYLTKAASSKVILGVPYYGYKYSTANTQLYAAFSGSATADTYSDIQSDLACALQLNQSWDGGSQTPWASWWSPATGDPCGGNHNSSRELYYDNAQSLGLKYDLVNSNNLRGTGIWALGYDGTSPDLWAELALKFATQPPFQGFGAVRGTPALIQSRFGTRGNFEIVVPLAGGGIVHYWRNNDLPGLPWAGGDTFGTSLGQIDALTMIESSFGSPGNLEVVARVADSLYSFWRDSGPAFAWHGPSVITNGTTGNPVLIQSRYGSKGNFELVSPLAGGGMTHLWRNNDDPTQPWSIGAPIGQSLGMVGAVTMIQSNYGSPGNLDLVARAGTGLWSFYRDTSWHGPSSVPGTAAGTPSMIQSRYGVRGNFELVTPLATGGMAHLWRNNDDAAQLWSTGAYLGQSLGPVDAASLIESNFGTPGDLELVGRAGSALQTFYRDSSPTYAWHAS
jgi:hypothetical protein